MANRTEKITVDVNVKGDKALDKLARSADEAKDEIQDLGKSMVPYVRGAEDAARATRRLATETERLARSERARRQTRGPGGRFAPGGGGGGTRIGTGGISLPVNPTTLAVGGVAAAGLSPVIGATAGGAILAGGALAGVGLGVAGAAANNPQIGNQFGAMVTEESKRWQAASRDFEEPTMRALKRIKSAVDAIPLEEMLGNASEFVDPLARGIAGFTESFGKGLGELIDDAGPIIDVLRTEIPRLGKSFQVMFDEIGDGSEGGAEALEDVLHVVERLIIGTGKVIHFLEDAYAEGVKLRKALPGDAWGDDTPKIIGYSNSILGVARSMDAAADATGDANEELETYEDTLHRLLDLPMELAEANAQYQESLDGLTDSIKENGRRWDEGTEAGRRNNEALRAAIQDAVALRDAQVGMGVQSGVANKQLEEQIAKLRAQAVAAGMSAVEFDKLTGALRNWMAEPSVKVIKTTFVTEGAAPRMSTPGKQYAFAKGGNFGPGIALVGEEGPEIVEFNGHGRVYNHAESKAMARSIGGGAQTSAGSSMTFGGNLDSFLAKAVMHGIRTGEIVLKVGGQRVSV